MSEPSAHARCTATPEERELFKRLRMRDERAFVQFYERYAPPLRRFVMRTLSREDAEEVVNDTFLEGVATYDPEQGRLSTWLIRIVRLRNLDRLKMLIRHRQRYATDAAFTLLVAVDDPEREVLSRIPIDGWEALTDRQRQVVGLYYYQGFSHAEIGRLLGIGPSSVKTIAEQARKKLRKQQPGVSPG